MAGPPNPKKVAEANARREAGKSSQQPKKLDSWMFVDETETPTLNDHGAKYAPSDTSSSAPPTTNAICEDQNYQEVDTFDPTVQTSKSLSPALSSAKEHNEEDVTVTPLEELALGLSISAPDSFAPLSAIAADGQCGEEAATVEDKDAGGKEPRSSSATHTLSSTNVDPTEENEDDVDDLTESPFKAYCLALLKSPASDGSELDSVVHQSDAVAATENSDTGDVAENETSLHAAEVTTPPAPSSHDPFGLNPPKAIDPWVKDTVERLLTVPSTFFNQDDGTFTLSLDWAIEIIGVDEFELSPLCPRQVLRPNSMLRRQGVDAGLSVEVWKWLAGSPAMEIKRFEAHNFKKVATYDA